MLERMKKEVLIVPVIGPYHNKEEFLNSYAYKSLSARLNLYQFKTGVAAVDFLKDYYLAAYGIVGATVETLAVGATPMGTYYIGGGIFDPVFDFASTTSFWTNAILKPNIEFIGFAEPLDIEFKSLGGTGENEELKENYENAVKDYNTIINSFASEKEDPKDKTQETFGERAFVNLIDLSYKVGQKRTMVGICENFKERYPESKEFEKVKGICEGVGEISNGGTSVRDILINGRVKSISLKGIYEPTFEEYGAEVFVGNAKGYDGKKELMNGQRIYLSKKDYIVLKDIRDDYVVFDISAVETSAVAGVTYAAQEV